MCEENILIADGDKGLRSAFDETFSQTIRFFYCSQHRSTNLAKFSKCSEDVRLYQNMLSTKVYSTYLQHKSALSARGLFYLFGEGDNGGSKARGVQRVPLSEQFPLFSRGLMGKTSNQAAESLNASMKDVRSLPVGAALFKMMWNLKSTFDTNRSNAFKASQGATKVMMTPRWATEYEKNTVQYLEATRDLMVTSFANDFATLPATSKRRIRNIVKQCNNFSSQQLTDLVR